MKWLPGWTRRCSRVLAAVAALSTSARGGQEYSGGRTRAVQGIVTHQDGEPVSGAAVEIRNLRNRNIRSFITDQDGKFHFEDLYSNLDYRLRARYHGEFGPPKSLSRFNTAPTATVNLTVK